MSTAARAAQGARADTSSETESGFAASPKDGRSAPRRTVIKFTRIPDDEPAKVDPQWNAWCVEAPRYVRLRRVTTLEDVAVLQSSRSLKTVERYCQTLPSSIYRRRKIVKIVEESEFRLDNGINTTKHSEYGVIKSPNRDSVLSGEKNSAPSQNLSRLSVIKKCEKEPKTATKLKAEEKTTISAKVNYKSKFLHKKKIYTTESTRLVAPKKIDGISSPKPLNSSPIKTYESRRSTKLNMEKEVNRIHLENKIGSKDTKLYEKPKVCSLTSPKATAKPKSYTNVQSKVDTLLKKKVTKNSLMDKNIENKQWQEPTSQSSNLQTVGVMTVSRKPELLVDSIQHLKCQSQREGVNTHIIMENTKPSHSELKPETKNQSTETSPYDWVLPVEQKCTTREIEIQTERFEELNFAELRAPHLNLTKELRGDLENFKDKYDNESLPNLQLPPFKISPRRKLKKNLDEQLSSSGSRSTSIIIGEATVTYTRKKKINFQMVGTTEAEPTPLSPATPLCVPPYPFTVMSMLKKELEHNCEKTFEKQKSSDNNQIHFKGKVDLYKWPEDLYNLKPTDNFKEKKLCKPSDIIQQIQDSSSILHSDYLSEQFQKELNFIDSFFDSLQYLENNCIIVNKPLNKTLEEDTNTCLDTTHAQSPPNCVLVSKFHHGEFNKYDQNQMSANKSLCLLNLLIRDEHRRAKNLLFILKMREDALKDFTKSQIIWLEKKKRSEEEDVSTLKKKQRGALLKLQQECGEMQRMKKALISLSDRRKDALIQTKRNIELKLSNGVHVDRILKSGKKRLRGCPVTSKTFRPVLPIKCFDLSGSSVCDDSLDTRDKMRVDTKERNSTPDSAKVSIAAVRAEKYIQTGDSIMEDVPPVASPSCPPKHLVKVDGAYLNILFHNLALPEIFSSGKEYEVNEQALQNILKSADRLHEPTLNDYIDIPLDQSKTTDKTLSKSSTPSTARSLVDEFDEYFNYLGGSEVASKIDTSADRVKKNAAVGTSDIDYHHKDLNVKGDHLKDVQQVIAQEIKKKSVQEPVRTESANFEVDQKTSDSSTNTSNDNDLKISEEQTEKRSDSETQTSIESEVEHAQCFPSVAVTISSPREVISVLKREVNVIRSIDTLKTPLVRPAKQDSFTSTSTDVLSGSGGIDESPLRSKSLPTFSEEEELRKKQLAIELEIKALEQQFIVREIPDKPPPPYTPPATDTSTATQTPTPITVDFTTTKQRVTHTVHAYCDRLYASTAESDLRPADSLEELLLDFCKDSMKKYIVEKSDEPWHPSNILPPKISTSKESVQRALSDEACCVLGLSDLPTPPPGPPILNKRSDYIDDILFAEWRKCETEWTALEADEVSVKNQLFASIFHKILEESVEDYKKVFSDSDDETAPE